MSGSTITAMRTAVERAGGRITEDAYLASIQEIITDDGGDAKIESLKVNAFNRKRMEKAGVTRVTIGTTKQVWLAELADDLLSGTFTGGSTASTAGTATTVTATVTDSGVFFGIERRNAADFDESLATSIPAIKGFKETRLKEFSAIATNYSRSLAGNTQNAHIMMEGPTGCGKSLAGRDFFGELRTPVLRLNMSDGVNEDTLIGTRTMTAGNVTYVHGLLSIAAREGLPIILEEYNAMRDSVMPAVNSIMDSGYLIIPENENEVIRAAPGFMVIATINPAEDYAGVNRMNAACRNRFSKWLLCEYLGEADEMTVIQQQANYYNRDLSHQLVRMANDLRRLKKDRKLETDTSTRSLISILMDIQDGHTMTEAINNGFIGYYENHERDDVKAVCGARLADY